MTLRCSCCGFEQGRHHYQCSVKILADKIDEDILRIALLASPHPDPVDSPEDDKDKKPIPSGGGLKDLKPRKDVFSRLWEEDEY